MDNSKGYCIYAELRSTSYPLATRHAPAKFAPASGTKRKLRFAAFVKCRGAQIALWLEGRQCSLVLDIGEDVDMQCSFFNYTIILSIYGYYPNVEYRRSPLLVVKYESVQYINC